MHTEEIKSLLLKYNQAGPRYTSYPPANHFTTDFTSDDYLKSVKSSDKNGNQSVSLYFHIPFCSRICFFCGCTTNKLTGAELVERYIDAIIKEFRYISSFIDKRREVTQIHFGGGTPNAIDSVYLKKIVDSVSSELKFSTNAEIAIECNPAYLSKTDVDALKSAGFNRFSLGIQDFNPEVLKVVNREQSKLPVKELVDYIRVDGKASVNLDFIYGLPKQTVDSFIDNMKMAAEIKPDRLVTFSYAHVPWVKKAQHILEKTGLPSADIKLEMLVEGYKYLTENGYTAVGMDHYARPDDSLAIALEEGKLHRNFQGYCTRETTGQVFAFGLSAISQLWDSYAQNTKDLNGYIDAINSNNLAVERGYRLNDEQIIVRAAINQLMCNMNINFNTFAAESGIDTNYLKKLLQFSKSNFAALENDGLVNVSDTGIEVTRMGSFVVRNIAMAIDPFLESREGMYSKTI
ncbi:MAG: oxygen-independent coproporphyrinogen III oxidase [Bacteroidales bacterium]|jgi:oxygen-independent coproporphyrinogen-3 oxidase|nr:oxygen-independent coproporphyrinogen III oxidase [Bacteroidales bacterium]